MREQLLLDRLALHPQLGIVLQTADELRHELVEAHAHGMLGVAAHLADEPDDSADHLLGGVATSDFVEADEAQVLHLGGDDLGDLRLDRLVIEHAGEL